VRLALYVLGATGLALLVALVVGQGIGDLARALAGAGWWLAVLVALHTLPLLADAMAWRALIASPARPSIATAVLVRWIGESVNGLLPAAQIGGEVVRARAAALRGVPGVVAGASVTVDLTLGVAVQIVLTLVGVGLLVTAREGDANGVLVVTVLAGVAVIALLVGLFYAVQRGGLFHFLARVAGRLGRTADWTRVTGAAAALDGAIAALYRDPGRLVASTLWRTAGWLLGAGEVWLALYALGRPVPIEDALMLEILGQAVRSGAFFVPAGLGVQEGGLMLLGGAVGVMPTTALALSLVKRVREISLGVPGLVTWQIVEGHRLREARRTP